MTRRPALGARMEANPASIQEWMGKWESHNPIGMYFSLTRRFVTVIVEALNEDAFFEALHTTWVLIGSYPTMKPVATADEFPALMHRLGMV